MIFITGGVRSGKSAFAEKLVEQIANTNTFYLATGTAMDEEMRARIAHHQYIREHGPLRWQTIEMDTLFPQNIRWQKGDTVLFECVTTWLANVQYASQSSTRNHAFVEEHIEAFKQQCADWQAQGVEAIIVSNELLDEPASSYIEVNDYRRWIGELHQWLVAQSDAAYEVDHQIVKKWK